MGICTRLLVVAVFILAIGTFSEAVADNSTVHGYPKPEVCLKTNIRCILKKQGSTRYWCLKSNLQRTLDARRNTSPISKTPRENLGHCAEIVPIRD